MFCDEIKVAELFHAKSPYLAKCKEGDLPLSSFPTWHVWNMTQWKQNTPAVIFSKSTQSENIQIYGIHLISGVFLYLYTFSEYTILLIKCFLYFILGHLVTSMPLK